MGLLELQRVHGIEFTIQSQFTRAIKEKMDSSLGHRFIPVNLKLLIYIWIASSSSKIKAVDKNAHNFLRSYSVRRQNQTSTASKQHLHGLKRPYKLQNKKDSSLKVREKNYPRIRTAGFVWEIPFECIFCELGKMSKRT